MTAKLTPNPDQVIVGVIFPPTILEKPDLTGLYGAIAGRYDYPQFTMTSPGAVLAGASGTVNLLPDRIQVIDNVGVTFTGAKEKAIDIIKNVFFKNIGPKIQPPICLGYGIKLISRLSIDGSKTSASDFIRKNLNVSEDQFKLLGQEQFLLGIRLNFRRNERAFEIRVEPWLQDPSKLWIELDVQFPGGPLQNILGVLEAHIVEVQKYFSVDIGDFLQHLRN